MVIKAIAAAVGAAAAVVGTASSIKAQKKAAKEAKKSAKFERQKAELQSARQKSSAIREARAARADATQAAENQGVATSSSAQGGIGSVTSQLTNTLSFLDAYGFLSDQSSKALARSASASANASMWSQVAQTGAQVYSATGGIQFKGPKPPAPK